jgi:hypothetical protein
VLVNCVLKNNIATTRPGGGASGSSLTNCLLTGNSAAYGGGAGYSTVVNCTLTGNSAGWGGGVIGGTVDNSIVYYNSCANGGLNYWGGALAYSCTFPAPGGTGNFTNAPMFVDPLANNFQLQTGSACIDAGNNQYVATSTDLNGNPRIVGGMVDIGAYEFHGSGPLDPVIQAEYTNVAVGFAVNFIGAVASTEQAVSTAWNFGDGTTATNQLHPSHSWSAPGSYVVTFTAYNDSFPGGVGATVVVQVVAQPVFYVNASGTNPVWPFVSWDLAATNIQDAIAAASEPGSLVLVTNGVYQTGGMAVHGAITNRVAVTKPVVVRSVNGAGTTVIRGNPTGGDSAVRCVYLTNHAALQGFTLALGATRLAGDANSEQSGGGVWCESTNATVSDCLLTGNWANNGGGGAFNGSFFNCTFTNNSAVSSGGGALNGNLHGCTLINNAVSGFPSSGGGAANAMIEQCALIGNTALLYGGGADGCSVFDSSFIGNSAGSVGGAVRNCTVNNSSFTNNSAWSGGGAAGSTLNGCALAANSASDAGGATGYYCTLNNCVLAGNKGGSGAGAGGYSTLNNCLLTGNAASGNGGGASASCTLNNCTLVENTAVGSGGGADSCSLNNCIVYFNSASSNLNYSSCSFSFSCTTPAPGGTGNMTNPPAFVNWTNQDFHLQSNSACINAGNNAYVTTSTDLDGTPRIQGGTVDMGAYEFQKPSSVISYAWLQQYSLATDGSADFIDSDGDGLNNWQEWIAGTDPTNPSSVLKLLSPSKSSSGIIINWQSVSGKTYCLQRSTNLLMQPAFSSVQSNLVGQAGTTSFTDTSATGPGPYFYRVGLQQ